MAPCKSLKWDGRFLDGEVIESPREKEREGMIDNFMSPVKGKLYNSSREWKLGKSLDGRLTALCI